MQPHKRAKEEYSTFLMLKNQRPNGEEENEQRYLISKQFLNKWLKYIDKMQQNSNQMQEDLAMQKRFAHEQAQLVEELVQSDKPAEDSYEVVNMKAWYLMQFLYGDQTGKSVIHCVIPTSELDNHIAFRENCLSSSITPKQYSQSGMRSRGGRRGITKETPQNVIINQNHYHIEQMNVNN